MTRVALATWSGLPHLDDDERLALAPLRALGVEARPVVWDAPGIDWAAFDLVVVRSTWDYTAHRDRFLRWADAVPRLANPAAVLRWNTDKRYLADLEADGTATVPTTFLAPGEAFADAGDGAPAGAEIVVKPSVAAGSRGAGRFGADAAGREAARAHVAALHAAGATAMVQPYLAAVDTAGETALLYLGGRFSHAIRKGPLLHAGRAPSTDPYLSEEIVAREPSPAERALGDRIVARLRERFGALLYARVDLLPGADGAPRVVEVELTEPSLFLAHADGAPERLAAAIADAAAAARAGDRPVEATG